MSLCGDKAAFAKDCDYPQQGGTESDVILLDWDDVQAELAESTPGITFDATTTNLVTDFTFTAASTRQGYLIQSDLNQVQPNSAAVRKVTGIFYNQTIMFTVPDNKASTDKLVKDWGDKRVVAIFKNKHKNDGGQGKYKIYGLDQGLVLSEAVQNAYENEGAHMLTWASDENTAEKFPSYTLYDTDEATTDAIWTALQTAA